MQSDKFCYNVIQKARIALKVINEICPICSGNDLNKYYKGQGRDYFLCNRCDLVFAPKEQLPSVDVEKTKYDQHQNSPQDSGYRAFLSKLFTPIQKFIKPKSHGLDFGSGPGPTLSKMLEEEGYNMDIYDIFYAPNQEVFLKKYDFITTTEVIEHLHRPKDELLRLVNILKRGGFLGVMTAFRPEQEKFGDWYYKNDPTHVRFFTPKTFEYIANMLSLQIVYITDGVVIFKNS